MPGGGQADLKERGEAYLPGIYGEGRKRGRGSGVPSSLCPAYEGEKTDALNVILPQEKEQAGKALSKADQERMGAFLAEYKKEAEARIRETMQAEGVICSQAEVEIEKDEKSGEYGKIRKIILHLKEEKMTSPQDEETKMVKEKAGEEVSVKVEIPPVITKEKQERPGTESKQEQQLKRKVAQYYGLEEACIEIWWEDDQGEMAVSASVRSDPDDPVYAISGKQQ